MFLGLKQSMVGPQQISNTVPKMGMGLGLPNGQAVFNLAGRQNTAPAPEVNLPQGMPGGGFKINITRTASSDPVQNIINDITNPLGGSKVDIGPQAQAQPPQPQGGFVSEQPPFMPSPWAPSALGDMGFRGPYSGLSPLGNLPWAPGKANGWF